MLLRVSCNGSGTLVVLDACGRSAPVLAMFSRPFLPSFHVFVLLFPLMPGVVRARACVNPKIGNVPRGLRYSQDLTRFFVWSCRGNLRMFCALVALGGRGGGGPPVLYMYEGVHGLAWCR